MATRNGSGKDLTVAILREIRDEMRGMHAAQERTNERLAQTNERLDQTNQRLDQTNERLAVVETTLRDLAEQMLVLGRAVKVARLEKRSG